MHEGQDLWRDEDLIPPPARELAEEPGLNQLTDVPGRRGRGHTQVCCGLADRRRWQDDELIDQPLQVAEAPGAPEATTDSGRQRS